MTEIVADAHIRTVVPAFYARVRQDPLIGPVFNAAIADWDRHLDKLCDFWSSVMNTTGRYKGNPMAAHLKHQTALSPAMFDRWLALWRETTDELLPASEAKAMQAKAANIAESLKMALFFRLPPVARPQPYKTTPEWNEDTLPTAVRSRHNTKDGVWGLLRVLTGEVDLVFHEPHRVQRVAPGRPAEIPPQAWHHVETLGPMRMRVEFYREAPVGAR